MQPVQVNLGNASGAGASAGPMLSPLHSENVDLASESHLSGGDLARAAKNLWSMVRKSLPWIVGAFGAYKIWESFSHPSQAKTPQELAAEAASRQSPSPEPSRSPASAGPIAGLREAALGVVSMAAAAIQDPEKRKPSDPFPLRLLRTVTRYSGPSAGAALAMEEAGPDIIRGTQLLAQGDMVHASGAFARAFVKTAATMAAAQAGKEAGGWAMGWLPGGRPVGQWLGWVVGSALGERLGNGALEAMGKLATSPGREASSVGRSPEASRASIPIPDLKGSERGSAIPPGIQPEGPAAGPASPNYGPRPPGRGGRDR
ncbi:hypothetical protein [Methylacidimicrobium sp. B4]|uniref:hypothetical protein n=1 Tax=Methylacidimicrobium sp. B4 TaxID=2796139 RepID=UPI001A8FEA29|nr:hypothetical protein [Methylacidimicrobium sp. B4]QSR85025.1 hypothetical protein MacB4_01785 [Methylacidimicrobium sp. B4]